MDGMVIGNRKIGGNEPAFFIAEAGINHNGSVEVAKKLIDAAKDAGADAVKFQTYTAESLMSKNTVVPKHVKLKEPLMDMLKKLELNEEEHREIAEYCSQKGIAFLSTPLYNEAVDLLDGLGVDSFKVASCDLDNLPLLKLIAEKGKPIILSTGMGTLGEVGEAVDTIHSTGNKNIVLLHCVANYPPKSEDVNLRAMETLRNAFKVPVGYSDHTVGINIPLAAVALGAAVIEKHFTLDKGMEGPDHAVSADPSDLKNMISGAREIEKGLGTGIKIPADAEIEMKKSFRRSVVVNTAVKEGEVLTAEKLSLKRPGTGIPPKYLNLIVGKKAKRNLEHDELITREDF
jgi:N-acetylneuraminate synthase/N,N'-diacetyllegionaminate synthase